MEIIASESSTGGTRQPIEPGLYPAYCCRIVHIGTIPDTYMGKPKKTNKILLSWELPTVRQVFNPEKGEQPRVLSKEYTLSLGEQAHLRHHLKSWRGRDFTPEELKAFNVAKLLGVRCMLNIGHRQGTDGKIYEEITAITGVPKDYPIPNMENPARILAYDEFDYTLFDSLSDKLKEKIKSSEEYKKMTDPEISVTAAQVEDDYEDLPF